MRDAVACSAVYHAVDQRLCVSAAAGPRRPHARALGLVQGPSPGVAVEGRQRLVERYSDPQRPS